METARALRGTKRTCTSCGERFYDLSREPITCPACGFVHGPEAFVRQRPQVALVETPAKPAPAEESDDIEIEDVGLADDAELIEETDDLDEDDDGMTDVVVDVDEDEEES